MPEMMCANCHKSFKFIAYGSPFNPKVSPSTDFCSMGCFESYSASFVEDVEGEPGSHPTRLPNAITA